MKRKFGGREGNMLSVFASLSMVFRSLGFGLPREKNRFLCLFFLVIFRSLWKRRDF